MIRTLQNTIKQDKECYAVPKISTGRHSHPPPLAGWDFSIRLQIFQNHSLLGYQLCHRLKRGQDRHVPGLFRAAQRPGYRLHHQDHHQQQAARPGELPAEILLPRRDDYLDGYRAEYNAMLMDKVTDSSNSVVQERYITLSSTGRTSRRPAPSLTG